MGSDAFVFFTQFLKNPRQLGSVVPSSGYLKRRIIKNANLTEARQIVELGPGNGGTTRSILDAMSSDANLLSIELNEGLYSLTNRIKDPRYIAHHGNAAELAGILAEHQLEAPDVVISGIPFSTMDKGVATGILSAIHEQLAPGGRFVAYQASSRVAQLNTFFPAPPTVELELLSVPPLRVWRWQKAHVVAVSTQKISNSRSAEAPLRAHQ